MKITLILILLLSLSCTISNPQKKVLMNEAFQKSVSSTDEGWINYKKNYRQKAEVYRNQLEKVGYLQKIYCIADCKYAGKDRKSSQIWRKLTKQFSKNLTLEMYKHKNSDKTAIIGWFEPKDVITYKTKLGKILKEHNTKWNYKD